MDMKIHMLICIFISLFVSREKEWGSYNNGDNYYKKKNKVVIRMKVVRLENEIVILGNCLWNCLRTTRQ
jgi:hypothetical protein